MNSAVRHLLLIACFSSCTQLHAADAQVEKPDTAVEKATKPADAPGTLTFDLPCQLAGGQFVTVHVAYPTLPDGSVDPAAADIVYYQGWWGEKEFWKGGAFKTLATERMTVVGMFFDAKEDVVGEKDAVPVIAQALEITRKKLGLPPGKALACGHSTGAMFINGVAALHPEFFDAIAPLAGNLRLVPKGTPAPHIPMLQVFSYGDRPRAEGALGWNADLRSEGWCTMLVASPVWNSIGSPVWLHLNTQPSIAGAAHWLKAIAELRRAHGGTIPAPSQWPQAPASQVASTFETWKEGETRPIPSAALTNEFAAIHRTVTKSDTLLTVAPRLPAKRLIIIVPPAGRSADNALLDAYLASDSEAVGVTVLATGGALPSAVQGVLAAYPDLPTLVIQHGSDQLAQTKLPERATTVLVEPPTIGTPGVLEIVAEGNLPPTGKAPSIITCGGAFKTADVRYQRFLMTAIRGGIDTPRSALAGR